jgi:uncharacterized membrane protein
MKSKAALGNHPIHPMIVPIPIGAFFLAMIGDLLHTAQPQDPFWYEFSFSCIGIGIVFALIAAVFGAIDYFGVKMSSRAYRTATLHGAINLAMVGMYTVSFLLRRHDAAMLQQRWPAALAFAIAGFVLLGFSGWLGGKLAFEHRVGVIEDAKVGADPGRVRAAS